MPIKDQPISQERLDTLHPDKRANFEAFIIELEATFSDFDKIRIVQAFRTFEEQDALYNQSRNGSGMPHVTDAKGGQSWHCYGLAIDIVPIKNGAPQWKYDYSKFAEIVTKYGLTWGNPWHDNDHYEDNLGHGPSGWKWALERWNAGKVDADGYLILQD